MEAFKPPIINQLALTDDVEGLGSVENRYQSSAKAFLRDQDPLRTFSNPPDADAIVLIRGPCPLSLSSKEIIDPVPRTGD
jgi:hypothetical protein